MLGPFGDTVVVVAKPLLEIGCHTDVEATFSILDDIDPRHGHLPEVVAGFEPAIRQLPDYEPDELPGCSTPRFLRKRIIASAA